MSAARNYDGGRVSVLSVLTDEFQSIGSIKSASKTTGKRAAKLLDELKNEGLVRMKWSRIGTKLYALPESAAGHEAQRSAVLGALTTEPQRLKAISEASGVPLRATARRLSELKKARKIVSALTSTGARSYSLPRYLKVVQAEHWRPQTRGDCVHGVRPCPYTGCKFHLYLDLTIGNNPKVNFRGQEPHEIGESCTLDLAARGGMTLEEIGQAMGVTREYARQLENSALVKLEHNARILREMYRD